RTRNRHRRSTWGGRIMAERRRHQRGRGQERRPHTRANANRQVDARGDDNLRAFVRVLARHAARELFEAQQTRHPSEAHGGTSATKGAIYARYSSDNQRDAAGADQIRVCRVFAEREGWLVADEFRDHAVSGATLLRPGFQELMRRALVREFHVVLLEV